MRYLGKMAELASHHSQLDYVHHIAVTEMVLRAAKRIFRQQLQTGVVGHLRKHTALCTFTGGTYLREGVNSSSPLSLLPPLHSPALSLPPSILLPSPPPSLLFLFPLPSPPPPPPLSVPFHNCVGKIAHLMNCFLVGPHTLSPSCTRVWCDPISVLPAGEGGGGVQRRAGKCLHVCSMRLHQPFGRGVTCVSVNPDLFSCTVAQLTSFISPIPLPEYVASMLLQYPSPSLPPL